MVHDNLRHFHNPTTEEPIACPVGEAIWLQYRAAHPNGLTVPPECPEDHPDAPMELRAYFDHVNDCDN